MPTVSFKILTFFVLLSLATCIALEAMGYRALMGHAIACTIGVIQLAWACSKPRPERATTVKVEVFESLR